MKSAAAADFSAFKTTKDDASIEKLDDYIYDEGYTERDRIDIPSLIEPFGANSPLPQQVHAIGSVGSPKYPNKHKGVSLIGSTQVDPQALVYSSKTAPYGQQFPSYVPQSMETLVGTTLHRQKELATGDDIVYGRGRVIQEQKDERELNGNNVEKEAFVEYQTGQKNKNTSGKNKSDTRPTADGLAKHYDDQYYDYFDDDYDYYGYEGAPVYDENGTDDEYTEQELENIKGSLMSRIDEALKQTSSPNEDGLSRDT